MSVGWRDSAIGRGLREFARFINAGLISNVVYFSTLGLLTLLAKEPLWLHAGIAYLLSAIVNYTLHYKVTFRSTSGHLAAIGRYIPVQAIALVSNSWILYVLVTKLGFHYLFGQVTSIFVTMAWTYLANRNWVFASGRT